MYIKGEVYREGLIGICVDSESYREEWSRERYVSVERDKVRV